MNRKYTEIQFGKHGCQMETILLAPGVSQIIPAPFAESSKDFSLAGIQQSSVRVDGLSLTSLECYYLFVDALGRQWRYKPSIFSILSLTEKFQFIVQRQSHYFRSSALWYKGTTNINSKFDRAASPVAYICLFKAYAILTGRQYSYTK